MGDFWRRDFEMLRLAVLLIPFFIIGCSNAKQPEEIAQSFIDSMNRGEVEYLQKWYADSIHFQEEGKPALSHHGLLRARDEWHHVARRTVSHAGLRVSGDTVFIDSLRESNDWLLLAGIRDVAYNNGAYIILRDTRIHKVSLPTWSRSSMVEVERKLAPFIRWTQSLPRRRASIAWVMPGWMRFRYSETTARVWMNLIVQWRVSSLTTGL
jgi:hypothetical protein